MPPKRNRLIQHAEVSAPPRTRHIVESSFNRLKDHRRPSLRLGKTEASLHAFFACVEGTHNRRRIHSVIENSGPGRARRRMTINRITTPRQ